MAELRYTKDHEWVRTDGDSVAVGISDHAQRELTDVVFVELPQVGRRIAAGESVAVVESVKTASDIYSPVAGEIIAVNKAVADNPGLVNSDPYGEGWLYRLKLSAPAELGALMSAEAYGAQIGA